MIEAKIGRILDLLNQKRWADEDLVTDLEFLTKLVEKTTSEMRLVFLKTLENFFLVL
jgi:hypothetical protein